MRLLVALLLVGAVAAQVSPAPSRFDYGPLDLGAVRSGSFSVHNSQAVSQTVTLVREAGSFLSVPDTVTVPAGGDGQIAFTYQVPRSASPGYHGETLRLVTGGSGPSGGSLNGATGVIFTSTTRAVGVLAIEAPDTVSPGATLSGAVLVVNTWTQNSTVQVDLALSGANGTVSQKTLSLTVAPQTSSRASFSFPGAPAGSYQLVASIASADPPSTPVSNQPFSKAVLIGTRAASVRFASTAVHDGGVAVSLRVTNSGSSTLTVMVDVVANGTASRDFPLGNMTLSAGEASTVAGNLSLDPGPYNLSATLSSLSGSANLTGETLQVVVPGVPSPAPVTSVTHSPTSSAPTAASGTTAAPAAGIPLWVWIALVIVLVGGAFLMGTRLRRR
ncbi:MAG: COG1361 family protein [Thermoplasmatota archaeon]